jgi:hypothetical protein
LGGVKTASDRARAAVKRQQHFLVAEVLSGEILADVMRLFRLATRRLYPEVHWLGRVFRDCRATGNGMACLLSDAARMRWPSRMAKVDEMMNWLAGNLRQEALIPADRI